MLQLISLLRVKHTEGVKVLGAANLELHHIFAPLDFHRACILPPSGEEEVFNLMNLLRLHKAPNTFNINYQNTIENQRNSPNNDSKIHNTYKSSQATQNSNNKALYN